MILLFNCTWVPDGPSEIRDSSSGCYTNIHLFILLLNINHVFLSHQWFQAPKICSFVSSAFWPFQNLNKYSYGLILSQCLKTFLLWGCVNAKVKSRRCPKVLWYRHAIRDSKWIQLKKRVKRSNESGFVRMNLWVDHCVFFSSKNVFYNYNEIPLSLFMVIILKNLMKSL